MNEEKIEAAVVSGLKHLENNIGVPLQVSKKDSAPKRRWSKQEDVYVTYDLPYNLPEVQINPEFSVATTGDDRWNIIVRILTRIESRKNILGGDWMAGSQAFYFAAADAIIAAIDEYNE